MFNLLIIAENWRFSTLIIVNISVSPCLDPKSFDIQRIILKHSKHL